jgi:hypothetical protein
MKMKMKVHVLSVAQKMFGHSSDSWASTITRFEGGDMIPEEYMMHCRGGIGNTTSSESLILEYSTSTGGSIYSLLIMRA